MYARSDRVWAPWTLAALAALAYTLMVRKLALQASELERASAATIRCRLLKIGAAILRNTRRVRFMLASHQTNNGGKEAVRLHGQNRIQYPKNSTNNKHRPLRGPKPALIKPLVKHPG